MVRAIAQGTLLGLFLIVSGCGSSIKSQAYADYDKQVRSLRTIGVLNPDILMVEVSAGGEREEMDEWEATAVQNMTRAMSRELNARQMSMKVIAPGKDPELEDLYYLNRAISQSLNWNATHYKTSLCSDERICKDYAVGPVQELLRKYKVDALLIVYGVNELETANRAAARKRSRAASFWVGMVSPVTFAPLNNPGTYLSIALIEPSGSVLWYSGTATGRGYDLRDQAVVDNLTKRIMSRMLIGKSK
jgi:hypothetical protein